MRCLENFESETFTIVNDPPVVTDGFTKAFKITQTTFTGTVYIIGTQLVVVPFPAGTTIAGGEFWLQVDKLDTGVPISPTTASRQTYPFVNSLATSNVIKVTNAGSTENRYSNIWAPPYFFPKDQALKVMPGTELSIMVSADTASGGRTYHYFWTLYWIPVGG